MRRRWGTKTVISLTLLTLLVTSPAITTPTAVVASDPVTNFNPAVFDQFTEMVRIRPKPSVVPVQAKNYLLLDAKTAAVIVAKNADAAVPVASTTKMTTALVARKLFKLDQVLTVPQQVSLIPGSDIQLLTGEKMLVKDLLRGLLIQSGNDTAFTLAYGYNSESIQPFVDKMNEYARENNLVNTRYGDPAGLDDENGRSTALDLAHTARLLLQDPVLSEIVRSPGMTITSADGSYAHELKSSNRLVIADSGLYLPTVTGVKTGFTPEAGHCLVASALINGRLMIGVVLNTYEFTITASASEMRKLFIWAENNVAVERY